MGTLCRLLPETAQMLLGAPQRPLSPQDLCMGGGGRLCAPPGGGVGKPGPQAKSRAVCVC